MENILLIEIFLSFIFSGDVPLIALHVSMAGLFFSEGIRSSR